MLNITIGTKESLGRVGKVKCFSLPHSLKACMYGILHLVDFFCANLGTVNTPYMNAMGKVTCSHDASHSVAQVCVTEQVRRISGWSGWNWCMKRANSKGDMKHSEWDIEMNDDKLLNYTPALSKVIFPKSLERIDSKHHLLCPSFHKKADGKNRSFPIGFWKQISQTPWDCPNPQNCKTSKNPMEIQFFLPWQPMEIHSIFAMLLLYTWDPWKEMAFEPKK